MLRKLMALAATTAMLGASAAAYAINSARAAVKGVTGSSAADENPQRVDGRTILPSIPPMAEPQPEPPAAAARRIPAKKSATKPVASHKGVASNKPGASKNAKPRAVKARSARPKSKRAK